MASRGVERVRGCLVDQRRHGCADVVGFRRLDERWEPARFGHRVVAEEDEGRAGRPVCADVACRDEAHVLVERDEVDVVGGDDVACPVGRAGVDDDHLVGSVGVAGQGIEDVADEPL